MSLKSLDPTNSFHNSSLKILSPFPKPSFKNCIYCNNFFTSKNPVILERGRNSLLIASSATEAKKT